MPPDRRPEGEPGSALGWDWPPEATGCTPTCRGPRFVLTLLGVAALPAACRGGASSATSCSFSIVSDAISSKMATVGVVEWSTTLSNLASANIVYDLNGASASALNKGGGTASSGPDEVGIYRTLLLGLKLPGADYTFHIEATDANGGVCKSSDYTLPTTGLLPEAPVITRTVSAGERPGQGIHRHQQRRDLRQLRDHHRRGRYGGLVRRRPDPVQPRSNGLRGREHVDGGGQRGQLDRRNAVRFHGRTDDDGQQRRPGERSSRLCRAAGQNRRDGMDRRRHRCGEQPGGDELRRGWVTDDRLQDWFEPLRRRLRRGGRLRQLVSLQLHPLSPDRRQLHDR